MDKHSLNEVIPEESYLGQKAKLKLFNNSI